ncbi:MAG TPA: GNAT family N-acetyltransferase [Pseudonocardiaceae bacterium]
MRTQDTLAGLSWRAITRDDAAAWATLLADAERVDRTGEHYSAEDLLEELDDPGLDAARDTLAAFAEDGAMVAYGLVRSSGTVAEADRLHVECCVHPGHRRRGLGREVFRRACERAREVHEARRLDVPGVVLTRLHDGNPGAAAVAVEAGLAPLRFWYDMQRDLDGGPPVVPAPVADGVRLAPFEAARDEATRHAHNEAFAAHWGSVARDETSWKQWFTGSRSFRAEVSLLALDGDEIAGYLLGYEYEADVAATGVREAWVGQIGVRPAWRGRGIGAALLTHGLAGFAAAGYQRVALGVDTGNVTTALRLYEGAGFTVTERWTSYGRPL